MAPWRWILVLALANLLLFVLLYPAGSFFIEDVLSSFLPYARAQAWPGIGTVGHLYFRLVYPLFGEAPLPYHLVTGLLHLLNTILLFLLVSRLARDRAAGLMAALIMSAHPGISATVFITKRVDTLCGVALCLAGLLLVLRWLGERGRPRHLILASLAALLSLACKPTVVGLWLLAPVLCLIPGAAPAIKTRLARRWVQAASLTASLFTLPVLLAGGLLLWSRANQQAEVGSISSLGEAVACLTGSWWERVLGLGALIQRTVAALPLVPGDSVRLEGPLATGQLLPAALLIFQLGMLFLLKSRGARLALLWLLLAALPFLLQTSPCAGFALKDKYLYMLLPGSCLLWGLILAEAGRLSARLPGLQGRGRLVGAVLCLLLCAGHLWSLQQRARQRDTAGRVVQQGLALLRAGLASPSPGREKLAYFFFPNEVHRYQTFTGGGDLVPQALAGLPGVPRPRHFTVEHPAYVGGETGWNLYHHLDHIPALDPGARPAQLGGPDQAGLPLPPGLERCLPVSWSRRVYVHHTHPKHGVQEITTRVLPGVRLKLNVRLGPEVRGPLYLGGDLAALDRAPLKLRDGAASVTLRLSPGLHRLCLHDGQGGRSYVLLSDKPIRHPVRGGFTLLPVANRALPLGLERQRGTAEYRRFMELKQQLLLAPGDVALRLSLLKALTMMGFHEAAMLELDQVRRLQGGEKP